VIFAGIAASVYLICKFINKKIAGITGDTLGAINELAEVIALFGICILEKGMT
jgi:cobalamin synthase